MGEAAAVFELQFAEDVGDVKLYGAFGNVEGGGDFLVGEAAHEQLKNFRFAGGEKMAVEKLRVQKSFGLFDEGEQDFGGNPELAFEDAANGLGEFLLPGFVELDETVEAPTEEAYFFGVAGVAGRKKREEFAAGGGGATAAGERAQVGVQGTRVQNEEARRIILVEGVCFV